MRRRLAYLCGLALLLPLAASAATSLTTGSLLGTAKGGTLSIPMQTVLVLTALTLLPAALVSVTPFLRSIIVLHFLRQALGTQTAPSNQVLVGLALFMTLLTMQPIAGQIYDKAWTPMQNGQMTTEAAAQEAAKPLRQFWSRFAKEKDIALFLEVSHSPAPRTPADVDLRVLIPALHPVGIESFLPNWRGALSALPGHRFGGGLGNRVGGHDAVAARDDLSSLQNSAVRFGGRLEPGGGLAHEELFLGAFMTADTVVDILRQALMMAFWVAGPLLLIGLVTGILVSLTQIVTSIQDSGFSTIPRLVIFLVAILLLMPWMIQRMTVYTAALLGDLGRYAR